jgi:hypothetical protein
VGTPSITLGGWTIATWLGWILGIPILIGLAAMLDGLGFEMIQFPVGLGMGLGVGLLQARLVRRLGVSIADWITSCAAGLTVPFAAFDVGTRFGYYHAHALYLSVALGGLIVGTWQAYLLRPHLRVAGAWVIASALGWMAASGSVVLGEVLFRARPLEGIPGALAVLGAFMVGGVILGAITGLPLRRAHA